MTFQLKPITPPLVPSYISTLYAAYAPDPVSRLFYPVPASPAIIDAATRSALSNWGQDPNERAMCAVEATSVGEQEHQQVVVSALIMNFVPSKRPLDQELVGQGEEMWRQRENWWETFGKEPVWERLVPEGWLAEGFCRVSRDTWRKQVEIMGGRAFIFIPTVVTHPSYHRRGAATQLLRWAISQARQYNLPIYLTASPSGLPVYKKLGFKVVDEGVKIDLSSVGIAEKRVTVCMILDAPEPDQPSKLGKGFVMRDGVPVEAGDDAEELEVQTDSKSLEESKKLKEAKN